jgi:hypothetical protein
LIDGSPVELFAYRAETITNRQFRMFDLDRWDRFYLPATLAPLVDGPPVERAPFVEDDNRSAIRPEPALTLDGQHFYLSVKGIGSCVDPFSVRPLDRTFALELSDDAGVRSRLAVPQPECTGGFITGELWLRGSPYGGQGLPHAMTALKVSERADVTNLAGFRIAPLVKIALLPSELEDRLRSIHWYRKFRGRMVQELRLVPSNVRIYFNARSTVGNNIAQVFDRFGVDTPARAHAFEVQFVRSGIAMLTLFARTMQRDPSRGKWTGLDFQDVWLDKDAVLAPDGTAFFVDLEGIEPVSIEPSDVSEKFEDQIYRSLYEFMFAFEQIAHERRRRFGDPGSRKRHFESIVEVALAQDPFVRVRHDPTGLQMEVRGPGGDESLIYRFPLVDY